MRSVSEIKVSVDQLLQEYYASSEVRAAEIDPSFAELIREMAVFIGRGGKRLRPYLTYLMYTGLGGTDEATAIRAGAALEMLHNFLLIHDDIIDRDMVRYGGLNIEGSYLKHFYDENARDPEHAALSAALLAGDVTASLGRELLYDLPVSPEQRLQVLRAFDEAVFTVGGGEFMDALASSLSHSPLSMNQIMSLYQYKTALYSFYLPLSMGALLAGADQSVLQKCRELAIPLGIAYQMRDDYLGLFGDASVTGKPITSDVREGKQTVFYALLRDLVSLEERATLDIHYGNPHADEQAVEVVRSLCREKGILEKVDESIGHMHDEALAHLEQLPISTEARAEIAKIIEYGTRRHE